MKHVWNLLLPGIAMLLFSGCTGPRVLELTERDSGRTLFLKTDDVFSVKLNSNPTTGYMWRLAAPYDEGVFILCGDEYLLASEAIRETRGAPGKKVMTFKVTGAGKSGLALEYVRPWEKKAVPAKNFELLVISEGIPSSIFDEEPETVPTVRRGSKGRIKQPQKGVFDE